HLPRSTFREKQMDIIIWSHRMLGRVVPSTRSMKRVEQMLQKLCGIPTLRYKGALGNVYYVNDMHRIIAQEFANPCVRPHLHLFPEERKEGLSEARHFSQWRKELDPDLLTPMVRVGAQDFYTLEPTLVV
ncbi:hypothetical protein FA15DRAFT_546087, partial [Coprinopsis marcescibilis]